ncbi:MAG: tetratricopeptide repeat protein [Holophagaceae bacterium]
MLMNLKHSMKLFISLALCLPLGRAEDVSGDLRRLIQEGRFIEAANRSDRLLTVNPSHPIALATKSQALSGFLDFDQALIFANKALQQNDQLSDAHLAKGIALMGLAIENISLKSMLQISQALDAIEVSTKRDPTYGYAWFTLGLSRGKLPLLLGGSKPLSFQCAQTLKKIDQAWGLALEGILQASFGTWKESESIFQEGLSLKSNTSLLVTAYLEALGGDEAKKALGVEGQKERLYEVAKTLSTKPDLNTHALESLGDALLSSDRPEEAWQLMQVSIPKFQESSLLKLQCAKISARTGIHLPEALELIEDALRGPIEGGSGGREGAYVRQGQILERLGKWMEAKKSFQQALEINPRHRGARENLERLRKKE